VKRKGQDMLIRSLPLVQQRVPDAALLVVGDGPMRDELAELARSLGVPADVVFAGAHPWAELPPFFAAGDVFCMPSRTRKAGFEVEGLGIVYLEASATGLPVVAGSSGGAPDTVREGDTGFVVDGSSPASIAGRVVDLLLDADLRQRLGKTGRAWVEERWGWELMGDRLRGLLRPAG
jgi:phosphatidylinositol alpha-1,6-mannosyltransferase